ncbi:MAG: NAD-dependent epimerase/dehydratase family protein [Candidatus Sumerlaeaceae bacterium]
MPESSQTGLFHPAQGLHRLRYMESFTGEGPGSLAKTNGQQKRRILVTGAAGNIGSYFAEHASSNYELLLMVHKIDENARALERFGKVVAADITDLAKLKDLCAGVDTVVHMAGAPNPSSTWDVLLPVNIIGTYNIMVAARHAGCRRVIFASSIHAVSGYPPDVQVKTTDPVNPGDLYGVSKCFGEALSRYMAEQEGVSVIALRIGAFQPLSRAKNPDSIAMMDAYVSHRDLHQLLVKCIEVENVRFAILNGLSDNRFKRLDISDARELVGYEPVDDLTELNPRLKHLELSETVAAHNLSDEKQESGLRNDL